MSVTARSSSMAPAAGTLGAIARAEWTRIWKLGKRRDRYQTRAATRPMAVAIAIPTARPSSPSRQEERHGDAEHRRASSTTPITPIGSRLGPRARKNAVQL